MKKIFLIVICFLSFPLYAATNDSPLGLWRTIDDVTGKPKAIVELTETKDKKIMGKILKIYPRPGYDQHELCTACPDKKKNQPIVGMVFLEDLAPNKDDNQQWIDGSILDPVSGKTYHATISLMDEGGKLNVHGYIGIPLFGRTQTWERVDKIEP